MAERPRSRTTIVVGIVTAALIIVLATIVLLVTTPWKDPVPRVVKNKETHSATK